MKVIHTAKNHCIIEDHNIDYFQSYETIVAKRETLDATMPHLDVITLDNGYGDYSSTTSRHLGKFLGESMKDIRAKVKAGTYQLADLN